MQPGDYCKRSIDDMRSGVVLGMHVRGRLAHVISGEPVEGWKSIDDLQEKRRAEIGDYVAYDDWVGQVRFLNPTFPAQSHSLMAYGIQIIEVSSIIIVLEPTANTPVLMTFLRCSTTL